MPLKKLLFTLFICLLSSASFGQVDGVKAEDVMDEDNVFFDGEVTDYFSGQSIPGVSVVATSGGKTIASGVTDAKGEYKIVLDYDKEYTITFSRAGLISKIISMNTNGVPDKMRQKVPDMVAEITLFEPNDCIQSEMLDRPIGRAKYFSKKNVIDWDMAYSAPLLSSLNRMLEECQEEMEKQKELEKQRERDCADAMKIGNKSFAKEDWDDAKMSYEKALSLCDKNEAAQKRIDLINTEIAKKAEAEKQRAEELARAEAEAAAKAEAEAAAKIAEAEKLAKEMAEKEALAKALAEEKELAKADAANKKAEEERLAKEAKQAEAKAKKEAIAKSKLKEEAKKNKIAEEKARKEAEEALANANKEEKAKILAQAEAKKRALQEAQALADKEAALAKEKTEREAKELAAQLAVKAEKELELNHELLLKANAQVKVDLIKQEEQEKKNAAITPPAEKPNSGEINGSSTIKFKTKNPTRHLYEKPNKKKPGKGPQMKKRMVF